MSHLKIATNFNIELDFEIPEFHKRLFAWVFDFLLFMLYLFLIIKLLNTIAPSMGGENAWLFALILFLPIAFYPLIMESTMNGQTIGKKIMKIKVINEQGGNATLSQYIIRWMLRVSDLFLLIMMVILVFLGAKYLMEEIFFVMLAVTDIFCVALTKKSQRLGDMAAGTILISTKTVTNLNDTVFMEISDEYVPHYVEVMRLSDRDMNTLRNIYSRIVKKRDYILAAQTTSRICTVLKIETKQDPEDFIETLLKDYNYLASR